MTRIPDEHHVARYCSSSRLQIVDGVIRGIFPQAFELRVERQETTLSTNYLEHRSGNRDEQLQGIMQDMAGKGVEPRRTGAFGVMHVGKTIQCGIDRSRALHVYRQKHDQDPSYATIRGLPLDNSDIELLNLLATVACVECVPIARLGAGVRKASKGGPDPGFKE